MEHNNIDACIEEWETLSNEYRNLEVYILRVFICNIELNRPTSWKAKRNLLSLCLG